MAKDRNTYAKRQREMEKKRKAGEKRERRAMKKQTTNESSEFNAPKSSLSQAEHTVLAVFEKRLMAPSQILCFDDSELEAFTSVLGQLTNKGFLVAEKSPGCYSLTTMGFTAMKGDG